MRPAQATFYAAVAAFLLAGLVLASGLYLTVVGVCLLALSLAVERVDP